MNTCVILHINYTNVINCLAQLKAVHLSCQRYTIVPVTVNRMFFSLLWWYSFALLSSFWFCWCNLLTIGHVRHNLNAIIYCKIWLINWKTIPWSLEESEIIDRAARRHQILCFWLSIRKFHLIRNKNGNNGTRCCFIHLRFLDLSN